MIYFFGAYECYSFLFVGYMCGLLCKKEPSAMLFCLYMYRLLGACQDSMFQAYFMIFLNGLKGKILRPQGPLKINFCQRNQTRTTPSLTPSSPCLQTFIFKNIFYSIILALCLKHFTLLQVYCLVSSTYSKSSGITRVCIMCCRRPLLSIYWTFSLAVGQGNAPGGKGGNYPASAVFFGYNLWNIYIQCCLFHCILHEIAHQLILSLTVLLKNPKILKILASVVVSPSPCQLLPHPIEYGATWHHMTNCKTK